ncbi:two-component sensor histidine kinase [Methylorubrum rhodinum]|uniref:histidine kinase n=1 Tax=Methylorubrum rhodinum TaxID=29428 RepID=A0A840ZKR4_9HYPH|nr:HWE histidine kinase domain-containing protein [Methylorubrum rhodinum]MBB5757744.1 two-component sensor histidine kinase [Methylorubrum rhodinum]
MPTDAELASPIPSSAGTLAAHRLSDRWPVLPLRLALALAFGTLGIVSTLALALLVHGQATVRLEQEVGAQLDELTAHMARTLDQGMFERWRDVQVVAALDTLREPDAPLPAKRAVLERLQTTYPAYSILLLTDAAGRIVATSNGLIEGADVSARDYFLAGRERPFAGDVHEAKLLAKLLPQAGGEPLRLVDLAAPVRAPDGAFAGIVAAHLDWAWVREAVAAFERTLTRQRAGTEILLLSRDGRVLHGPPDLLDRTLPSKTLAGARRLGGDAAGPRIGPWPDGRDTYLFATEPTRGFRDYPGLGWTVAARVDAGRALAPVRELSTAITVSGLAVALVGALLTWLLAGRLARPLDAVCAQAERLGRGEPLAVLPATPVREIRDLGQALDAAARELRQRDSARRLLVDELNHRVKNTLATVQSFALQSFRGLDGAAAQRRDAFEGRLLSLSAAHNILTREHWAGAGLRPVIDEVLRPFEAGGSRFTLSGPDLRLPPRVALALGMVLHELCTNAAKHGALSRAQGRVALGWEVGPAENGLRRLHLVWRETGGPPVATPSRRGFGSRLIERGLASELGGSARIGFPAEGVVCEIVARVEEV